MRKPGVEAQSQLMELLFHVAEQLGQGTDRDLAELAEMSPENVANWRLGRVQEMKAQTLQTVKANLGQALVALRERARAQEAGATAGLTDIEVEEGSGPSDLQRQFRDRVDYDYLGHRFLYFEPQGALAWENLIRAGYDQDIWRRGVVECATEWLDPTRDAAGRTHGPLAAALGLDKRGPLRGFDVVSLGPGEGEKELGLLEQVLAAEQRTGLRLRWLCFAPVDVSISLLLTAARGGRRLFGSDGDHLVRAFVADFEEGPLAFAGRLPTARVPDGRRLVVVLGNVFGNVRSEDAFVRQRLGRLLRPGDLLWLEVGLRPDTLDADPLFRMTRGGSEETAAEANRRRLLEGPYRRWEAAQGRRPAQVEMRVWVREHDDSAQIPESCNFCHDLVLPEERRVVTMLYSRRYRVEPLCAWMEARGLEVLRVRRVEDSTGRPRVAHVLMRRT